MSGWERIGGDRKPEKGGNVGGREGRWARQD